MSNLMIGTVVDNYVIEQAANSGGFARTYFVRDVTDPNSPLYFLKELFPDTLVRRMGDTVQLSSQDEKIAKQWNVCQEGFEKEASVLSNLNIPTVPKLVDAFSDNNTLYIVQEKIEGIPLDEWFRNHLQNKGFEANLLMLSVLTKLLKTLEAIHKFNVLHRDIKSSNILVDQNDQPYLLDFGAARLEVDTVTYQISHRSYTPGYASLEQTGTKEGQLEQGAASDLYSLAATFYFLLFEEEPPEALDRSIGSVTAKKFVSLSKRYDTVFLQSLDKAFEVLAKNRYTSASDWLEVLEPLNTEYGTLDDTLFENPEYNFQVGRTVSETPAVHRVVTEQSDLISRHHLDIRLIIDSNKDIEVEITDWSANGTAIIDVNDNNAAQIDLVNGQTIKLPFSLGLYLQIADYETTLSNLVLQFAQERGVLQLTRVINNLSNNQATRLVGNDLGLSDEPLEQDMHSVLDVDDNKLSFSQLLFSFKGTISRRYFWLYLLSAVISVFVIGLGGMAIGLTSFSGVSEQVQYSNTNSLLLGFTLIIGVAYILTLTWAYYAVATKRLRAVGVKEFTIRLWLSILFISSALSWTGASMVLLVNSMLAFVLFIMLGFVPNDTFSPED